MLKLTIWSLALNSPVQDSAATKLGLGPVPIAVQPEARNATHAAQALDNPE